MPGLQEDVLRASTLAHLDRIIDSLRDGTKLTAWPAPERMWLASLLEPFKSHRGETHRLMPSDGGRTQQTLLLHALIESLLAQRPSGDEITHFIRLCTALRRPRPEFVKGDEQRLLGMVEAMRRWLMDDVRCGSSDQFGEYS